MTAKLSSLVEMNSPRSEERLDLVEQYEEMQRAIAARHTRQKFFLLALLILAICVVLPVVALAIQNQNLTDTQRETLSHTFN